MPRALEKASTRVDPGWRTHHRQADESVRQRRSHRRIEKVVSSGGWFVARPWGTENIYKICAGSFQSESHLNEIVSEAQELLNNSLGR